MNPEQISNMCISLFRDCTQTKKLGDIPLRMFLTVDFKSKQDSIIQSILKLRSTVDTMSKKNLKSKLPCATISCITNTNGRSKQDILRTNPLVTIDIDFKDNPLIDMNELKHNLFKEPYIYSVYRSCSGNGLCAIAVLSSVDNIENRAKHLFQHIDSKFNINTDKSCSNITRLRYISYDRDILIKSSNEEIIPYEGIFSQSTEIISKGLYSSQSNMNLNDKMLAYVTVTYLFLNKIISLDDYNSWFNIGWRLAYLDFSIQVNNKTFDHAGQYLWGKMSQCSDNFDPRQCIRKWDECLKVAKANNSPCSLAYFFKIAKTKLGKNWRQIVIK